MYRHNLGKNSGFRWREKIHNSSVCVVPSEATPVLVTRHDRGIWSRDRCLTLTVLRHSRSASTPADGDAFWTLGCLAVGRPVCRDSHQNKFRSRCTRTNLHQNGDSNPSSLNTRRAQWVTMAASVKMREREVKISHRHLDVLGPRGTEPGQGSLCRAQGRGCIRKNRSGNYVIIRQHVSDCLRTEAHGSAKIWPDGPPHFNEESPRSATLVKASVCVVQLSGRKQIITLIHLARLRQASIQNKWCFHLLRWKTFVADSVRSCCRRVPLMRPRWTRCTG